MADITKSPQGTWRARLYKNGRRESRTFRTKGEASAWIERRRAELSGRAALRPFSEWCDTWLATKGTEIEPRTLSDYQGHLDREIRHAFGTLHLGNIKPHHVRAWLNRLADEGASASKRKKLLDCLKQVLKDAVILEQIPTSPAAGIKSPKQEQRTKARSLNEAEVAALLKAAEGTWVEALVWFSLDTGCRPGEAYALAWSNLDIPRRQVRICESLEVVRGKVRVKTTKTAETRVVTITKRTAELLDALPRLTDRVFPSNTGKLINVSNFRRQHWSPLIKVAGLKHVRQYDLRHTCATMLLSKGVPIKVVAERLGHSSVITTLSHYGHCIPSMQQQATDAMENIFSENFSRADLPLANEPVDGRSDS